MSRYSALLLVQMFLVTGDADAVGVLTELCVRKRARRPSRLQLGRYTCRAQARRKRINFTECLTLLRLLTKRAFMMEIKE